jgi:hypothetical protein
MNVIFINDINKYHKLCYADKLAFPPKTDPDEKLGFGDDRFSMGRSNS